MKGVVVTTWLLLVAAGAILATDDTQQTVLTNNRVFRNDLEEAKQALEVFELIIKAFNEDLLKDTPIGQFVNMIKAVLTLANILDKRESAEMQFMREQFEQLNGRLNQIEISIDEVKRLISWESARGQYSEDEKHLRSTVHDFDMYMKASNDADVEARRDAFRVNFGQRPLAARHLYQGVVDEAGATLDNLATACMHFTGRDRRKTNDFLKALYRHILQGSLMEILYERLQYGEHRAKLKEEDWQTKMETLTEKLAAVDEHILNTWEHQAGEDADTLLAANTNIGNQEFSGVAYRHMSTKFYWRQFLALNYDVSDANDGNKSKINSRGSVIVKRRGNRVLVIASVESDAASLDKSAASGALQWTENRSRSIHSTAAWRYTNELTNRMNSLGKAFTMVATVCWGCNVWLTTVADRFSSRHMTLRWCNPFCKDHGKLHGFVFH